MCSRCVILRFPPNPPFLFFKSTRFALRNVKNDLFVCLKGPNGLWCDVDVVEFSYYGTSSLAAPKEKLHTELVQGLQGNDTHIGPGSQVTTSPLAECLNILHSPEVSREPIFLDEL